MTADGDAELAGLPAGRYGVAVGNERVATIVVPDTREITLPTSPSGR